MTAAPATPPLRKRSEAAPWKLPEALDGIAVGGDALLADGAVEPDFVVEGLLEAGDFALYSGEEKEALKTWQMLALAVARILGGTWLGRKVASGVPGRVLLISCETSRRNVARRLRSLCLGLNVPVEEVAPYLYVIDRPITILPLSEVDAVREKAFETQALAAVKINDAERRSLLHKNVERLAQNEADRLGQNLATLEAIVDSPKGTWSLILIDTVRQTLSGDENSSRDAGRYTQGCRELARAAGCPVIATHHTNKTGTAGDSRSSRGSVELTAGPDALFTIDTSGEYPTAHFKLRNHESPAPVGYRLDVDKDGAGRIDVLPACGRAGGADEDDVLEALRAHPDTGLTLSKIREYVAAKKGGKKGAKANQKVVEKKLASLERKKLAARCEIRSRTDERFEGWRLGPVGGVVAAKPISMPGEGLEDPTDV